MRKILELNPRYLTNSGFIKAGFGPRLLTPDAVFVYRVDNLVHLHTATPDIGGKGNNDVFNNGVMLLKWDRSTSSWVEEFNTNAFYPNARTALLPVRSIENERETDFIDYTEEGFYRNARSYR